MTPRSWTLAEAFDRAAPSYDAMVALSPGYHDQLARAAAALVERLPEQATVLDLGCGSGASTQAILTAWEGAGRPPSALTVLGVDASAGMIAQALRKRWPATVTFDIHDAVHWLADRDEASVDGILAAYLVRNVPDRDALIAEIARVLRPGGLAWISEPIYAGDFNEVIRLFHDEKTVREAAFAAECRAVEGGILALDRQLFFQTRSHFADFAEFDARMIQVTHTKHRLSPDLYAQVRQTFEAHLGPEGATFYPPQRVDVLKKPG